MWILDRGKTKCLPRQAWEKDEIRVLHETWTRRVTDGPAPLSGSLCSLAQTHRSRLQRDCWWACVAVVSVSFQPSEGVTRGSLARLPRISRLAKGETETTASRLTRGELGHFLCAFCTPLGLVRSIQICPDIQTSYHLVKQPISKCTVKMITCYRERHGRWENWTARH